MIATTPWTEEDTARADQIWAEYQRTHDLADRLGQTAGIDPKSGRVWLGESIADVAAKQASGGHDEQALFFYRVGYASYFRKGRR